MFVLFTLSLLIALIGGQPPPIIDDRGARAGAGNRLRVAALTSAYQPFLRIKSNCAGVDPRSGGNAECRGLSRFEGFCIDVLNGIRNKLPGGQFNYEIVPSDTDDRLRLPNGNYNGTIGLLERRAVELACTPMVINDQRQQVMDFSQPLMRTSIGILMKQQSEESCFSLLLRPFTCGMWLFILGTFLVLLLLRYLLLLLKQKLRGKPVQRVVEEEVGLVRERRHIETDENPKIWLVKNLRRLLKYLLWAFTLLLLVFYLANLVSYLVVRRSQQTNVRDIDDLLMSHPHLQLGIVRNGNTHQFFRQSPDPKHQRLLRKIESQVPSGFVANYTDGIEKVQQSDGNFALLLEESAIDYARRMDCSLMKTGFNVDSNFIYAIAMPLGSPLRGSINGALQTMESRGELEKLRNKWWMEGGEECPSEDERFALGFGDLCGLLIVLPLLLLLGLLFYLLQYFLRNRRQRSRHAAGHGKHGEKERMVPAETITQQKTVVSSEQVATKKPDIPTRRADELRGP